MGIAEYNRGPPNQTGKGDMYEVVRELDGRWLGTNKIIRSRRKCRLNQEGSFVGDWKENEIKPQNQK